MMSSSSVRGRLPPVGVALLVRHVPPTPTGGNLPLTELDDIILVCHPRLEGPGEHLQLLALLGVPEDGSQAVYLHSGCLPLLWVSWLHPDQESSCRHPGAGVGPAEHQRGQPGGQHGGVLVHVGLLLVVVVVLLQLSPDGAVLPPTVALVELSCKTLTSLDRARPVCVQRGVAGGGGDGPLPPAGVLGNHLLLHQVPEVLPEVLQQVVHDGLLQL